MQAYPHRYHVHAAAETEGNVLLGSEGLPTLTTAAPPQYGGPGGQWSPETLLMAAAADCFILTFRAIATASKLAWGRLDVTPKECSIEATASSGLPRCTCPPASCCPPAGTPTGRSVLEKTPRRAGAMASPRSEGAATRSSLMLLVLLAADVGPRNDASPSVPIRGHT